MEPLISVIVPVYNVENYLRRCVDSILNQTYSNLEVIIVDDDSPDGCPVICDGYAVVDSRVKVIHKENGGLSSARNAGMAVAKGEYLMFVDSDDLLPVDAARTLMDIALAGQVKLVIGGHARFEEKPVAVSSEPVQWRVLSREDAIADMLRNGCAAWARVYHRSLHEGILFPVGEINEDEAVVLQLYERLDRIAQTDTVVYHYRYRPESITTAKFSPKKMDWFYHCKSNLAAILGKYPHLAPLALDRAGSSVVFLLHQMALCDYQDQALCDLLLKDLRQNYRQYQKNYLSGWKEKFRMWFLRYLPYELYRMMIKLTKGCE